ncbi:hypothetical protein KJ612_09225 [Myxococcota bacterium]|nr:hypothetical protein [Myxococcota bacterium]
MRGCLVDFDFDFDAGSAALQDYLWMRKAGRRWHWAFRVPVEIEIEIEIGTGDCGLVSPYGKKFLAAVWKCTWTPEKTKKDLIGRGLSGMEIFQWRIDRTLPEKYVA